MFNKINEATLLREVAELKKQVAALKDEQIKQRRDQSDQMYNLDSDNVPTLNGIVKEIRLIVKDGAVNGALIIQAINSAESEAQILASHINLSGMTINLNAGEGITITSPNFSVTKEGNMTCQNAEIKKSCAIATDLGDVEAGTENGMLIGPIQETDEYKAATWLSTTRTYDGPGIRFRSEHFDKLKNIDYTTDIVMTGKKIKLVSTLVDIANEKKEISGMGLSTYRIGDEETKPRPYMIGPSGGGVWIDDDGELYTSSQDVHTAELVPMEFFEELFHDELQADKEET